MQERRLDRNRALAAILGNISNEHFWQNPVNIHFYMMFVFMGW